MLVIITPYQWLSLQEISNTLAKLSVYACARLGGYLLDEDHTTPDNPAVKKSLTAMLTPYLAKKLADNSPHEVITLIVLFISLSAATFAVIRSHYGSSGGADLRFHGPQPDTSLRCQTTDTELVYRAVCLFTFITHHIMDYYSFYRPRRDGWLSWSCWLTDSGCFTHEVVTRPAVSLALDRESSPARTGGLTTMLHHRQLVVPRNRLNTFGRRAFAVAGPMSWNSLPNSLRESACYDNISDDCFKHSLKTFFFSGY